MYSTKYTNAPLGIRILFEYEIKENKNLNDIIQYIILSTLLLFIMIIGLNIWYIFVIVTIIKTINIIVNFITKGNKIYEYSDLYNILQKRRNELIFMMKNATFIGYKFDESALQKGYYIQSEHIFNDIKLVNDYILNKDKKNQLSSISDFIKNNLLMLNSYLCIKNTILFNSLWFKREIEHKKWYSADFAEKNIALNTGTELNPNYRINPNWFENNILQINNRSLVVLFDNYCYTELIEYINFFVQIIPNWIKFGDIDLLMEHIKYLSLNIQKSIFSLEDKDSLDICNILEMLSYLYRQCVLSSKEYINSLDLKEVDKLYNTDFRDISLQKFNNKIFNCSEIYSIYKKLKNEFDIEKKKITPLWYVKQRIYKFYIEEINKVLKVIEQLYILNLDLENIFFKNKNYTYSSSFITNENEMHNKILYNIEEIKKIIENIMQYDIEKQNKLPESYLDNFITSITNIHQNKVPYLWENHCKIWALRIKQNERDIFGFCYNNLIEYLFESIITFDFDKFSEHYKTFFTLSIISETVIYEDIKNLDLNSNIKLRYQVTGLNALFKISGYAILVGDILKDRRWKELIDFSLESMLKGAPEEIEKKQQQLKRWKELTDILVNGTWFMGLIDITNMERRFSCAIENSNKLEFENIEPFGYKKIINSPNLENLYYDISEGFSQDVREVYAIATLNKFLSNEDKYKTRNLKIEEWKDINDKEKK